MNSLNFDFLITGGRHTTALKSCLPQVYSVQSTCPALTITSPHITPYPNLLSLTLDHCPAFTGLPQGCWALQKDELMMSHFNDLGQSSYLISAELPRWLRDPSELLLQHAFLPHSVCSWNPCFSLQISLPPYTWPCKPLPRETHSTEQLRQALSQSYTTRSVGQHPLLSLFLSFSSCFQWTRSIKFHCPPLLQVPSAPICPGSFSYFYSPMSF